MDAAKTPGQPRVNHPLGLTVYCSGTPAVLRAAQKGPSMRHPALRSRLLSSVALIAVAMSLGGCMTSRSSQDVTGSIAGSASSRSEEDWRRTAEAAGERHRSNPQNPQAAIDYAQALRYSGQKAQAAAVL